MASPLQCVVAVIGMFGAGDLLAGPIFKCVDAKGVVSYQQEPCPKASTQAGRGYVAPVKSSPNNSWAAQSGELARQQRRREALYDAERPRVPVSSPITAPPPVATVPTEPKPRNDRVQNNDLGTTKIDQYGRPYTKVAPNVLIDQRTSRPCITNGNNEIVSCQ